MNVYQTRTIIPLAPPPTEIGARFRHRLNRASPNDLIFHVPRAMMEEAAKMHERLGTLEEAYKVLLDKRKEPDED